VVLAALDEIYIPTEVPLTTESGFVEPKTEKLFARTLLARPSAIPPERTLIESVVKPTISTVVPEGAALVITFTDSSIASDVKFTVAVMVPVSPGVTASVLALNEIVEVAALRTADDVPVERTPNPNAATTTSAIRLKLIDLLVICFLSIVVLETFSSTAGEANLAS
jgi:hypothetical protein